MTGASGENGAGGGDGVLVEGWMKWNNGRESVVLKSRGHRQNGKDGMGITNYLIFTDVG